MKIDYKSPNYTLILKRRSEKLRKLRKDKRLLAAAKIHYKSNPWDFVNDWGMTYEPRNVEKNLPTVIPFVLWPKQRQFMQWMHARWQQGQRGLGEKSRDFGATWIAVSWACSMCLFWDGFAVGFGSRKQEKVDKKGDPDCIFEKIRLFMDYLPKEFLPNDWDSSRDIPFMKMINRDNGSTITGEGGDDIGRGGRKSVYIVDEAAFIPRQEAVDAALSQTTNCQIDLSTPNGNGNLFYKKRHNGKIPVFVMDWRDDPRKDEAWYNKQVDEQDPVTVAQEIDRDYSASKENIFIPAAWVKASIDAHLKLGFQPEGMKRTAFDPADVGDAKGHLFMHGSVVLEAIAQKKGDIREAVTFASQFADDHRAEQCVYDADGLGAPTIKLSLEHSIGSRTLLVPFHGGGLVEMPDAKDESGKKNRDRFKNLRAQAMTKLRKRFQETYNAVVNGKYADPDELISISSKCKNLHELTAELSRPERQFDSSGKVKVESKPDMKSRGVESPNLSDCLMMLQKTPQMRQEAAYIPRPIKVIGG